MLDKVGKNKMLPRDTADDIVLFIIRKAVWNIDIGHFLTLYIELLWMALTLNGLGA